MDFVTPFSLSQVKLVQNTDLYEKTMLNAKYMVSLDPDRLLYNFRKNAGLDCREALPYGVWEGPEHDLRGHFTGHYLTACAKMYISLEGLEPELSAQMKERAGYMVKALKECQDALAKTEKHPGYLAAVPSSQFDDLERLVYIGVPYYNIHKTMCGLVDCYLYLNNLLALDILTGMADYFRFRLSRLSESQKTAMLETKRCGDAFHMEFGGMHEVLLRLYEITKDPAHFQLAQEFDRGWFRDMLKNNEDLLGKYALHANTEIPCAMGLARHYDLTGEECSKEETITFMDWLLQGHQLPTGSVSGRSAYPPPEDYGGELFDYPNLFYKHLNFNSGESCCSHNLNEIAHKVFQWTGDVKWAQEYERRFVNAVLAQQHPETGGFVYHLSMAPGSFKKFSTDGFFCCNGTGIEYYASLTANSFFHQENHLWVTNYVSARVNWEEQGVALVQETKFPMDGKIVLRVQTGQTQPKHLHLHLRIPAWTKAPKVCVNGVKTDQVKAGEFLLIDRDFSDNDTITADFPFHLYAKALPDRPSMVSVFYGPNLLVACAATLVKFDGTADALLHSLKPEGSGFTLETADGSVLLRPICTVVDEKYGAFLSVTKAPRLRVCDEVIIGDGESETAHDFQDKNSMLGTLHGFHCRSAEYGGFFSYTLKLDKKASVLACTYSDFKEYNPREDKAEDLSCFDIELSNGVHLHTLATQTIAEQAMGTPVTIYYPINPQWLEGASEITLRFTGVHYHHTDYKTAKLLDRIQIGCFSE